MTGIRLAVFLPSLAGGGAERMIINLTRGALDAGVEVDLVAGNAAGPYLDLVPAGARLIDLQSRRVLAALPGLVRYLRRQRPAALLSAMDHANMVALWARALARVQTRVYVSVRSNLSQEAAHAPRLAGRLMPRLARAFYPGADAVIAVSQGVADDLGRLLAGRPSNMVAIPNPVVTPELADLAAEPPAHPWLRDPAVPVCLAAGRLCPQKDYPTLIRAVARLAETRPLRLLILGEGPERPALESLVRQLGLTDRAELPGFLDNPFAAMARARVFVLSSAWEGLPGVLIQAMACGTPVVATDCPSGPREILGGGRYGPLVPIRDPQALAQAIGETLDRPLGADLLQGRAADFSLAAVTRRYLEVLGLAPNGSAGAVH